ncbi:lipid-A-disaccharide kinase [Rhodoferax sp. OV413]|uniref:tetraacyldisaccharide 4'-kinase n=1 Tax=Rhodoferax sp. OV413 TaxID=1855285 RepID=UPI00088CD6AE|nr:tetraacyldisaccharide 4'-kinase [Rhodoferax sp. OV413]SDO12186.1 lipid-A-disaccharide kinase [Rhodoferax sp. OV413]
MGLEATLLRTWRSRGALAWLLWPLSLLYGLLGGLRNLLYRLNWLPTGRVPVPVIVVGNVVAGGSGKTPVVMALVRHWQARGIAVGVISRGYGRSSTDCREVLPDSLPAEVGDEPALVHRSCQVPVFVARQRLEAAQALLARYPQTQLIVCDDGLQHRALHRDLEICIFDDRGVGNGFLLPAGPLREAWPRPVDLVLHSGAQPAFAGFRARRSLADYAVQADGRRRPLSSLQGTPLLALAAIAQPQSFFTMLRAAGLSLDQTQALPDHYDFDSWTRIEHLRQTVICTEKDAVKLWRHQPDALAVPLVVELEAGFLAALDQRVDPWLSSPPARTSALT